MALLALHAAPGQAATRVFPSVTLSEYINKYNGSSYIMHRDIGNITRSAHSGYWTIYIWGTYQAEGRTYQEALKKGLDRIEASLATTGTDYDIEYALYFPNASTVNVPYFTFKEKPTPGKNFSGGADPDSPAKACRQEGYGQFLDPVHGLTGNIGWHKQDIFEGLPFDRFYNSLNSEGGGRLSAGWSHGYGQLIRPGTASALAVRPNGTPIAFQVVNGAWVNAQSGTEQLMQLPSKAWILRLRGGDEEVYAQDGTLQAIRRSSGQVITVTHGAQVVNVRDQFGKGFDLQLNDRLHIAHVVSPEGVTLASFTFDEHQGARRLTAVTYPGESAGQSEAYLYENTAFPLQMTGIVDEKNTAEGSNVKRTAWSVDADGYPSSVTQGGSVNEGTMSRNGHVVTVTDGLGVQRTHTFKLVNGRSLMTSSSQPAGSGCDASVAHRDYDAVGNPIVLDDFKGTRTCMAYSGANAGMPANLETVRVEGLVGRQSGSTPTACAGVLANGAALPSGARKTSTQWHPQAQLKIQENIPLKRTIWVYHGQPDPTHGNQVASCVVPMFGASSVPTLPSDTPLRLLCRQVEQATGDANGAQGFAAPPMAAVPARIRSYTYNQFGQVLTATDAAGNVTAYHYYTDTGFSGTGFDRVGHRMGDLWKTVNAKGHEVVNESYDTAGRVKKRRQPSGLIEVFAYAPRGWLLREKQCAAEPCDAQSAEGGRQTVYEYWPNGLLRQVRMPDGATISYGYDDAQRLTSITDAAGNSTTYVLDAKGNRIEEKVRDQSGALARSVHRAYDALDRLQSVTGARQ